MSYKNKYFFNSNAINENYFESVGTIQSRSTCGNLPVPEKPEFIHVIYIYTSIMPTPLYDINT